MSSHCSPESEGSTSASNVPDTGSSPSAKPTKRLAQSSGDTGQTSRSTKTSADLTATGASEKESQPIGFDDYNLMPTGSVTQTIRTESAGLVFQSTSSAAASRAKTYQSQGSAPDSQASDQGCSSRPPESLTLFSETEDGFSLRMFPDSFPRTADEISPSFSRRWPTSGFTTSPGECWTVDSSECHSDGGAFSSLPDVLVADVPPRFYLSPKAAAGIIRRAEKRGRSLPRQLDRALTELAQRNHSPPGSETPEPTSPTPRPDGSSRPASLLNTEKHQDKTSDSREPSSPVAISENQRAKVRETHYFRQLTTGGGKPGQGHPTVRTGQSVRRLTPTECERLQGFPDGWTIP